MEKENFPSLLHYPLVERNFDPKFEFQDTSSNSVNRHPIKQSPDVINHTTLQVVQYNVMGTTVTWLSKVCAQNNICHKFITVMAQIPMIVHFL